MSETLYDMTEKQINSVVTTHVDTVLSSNLTTETIRNRIQEHIDDVMEKTNWLTALEEQTTMHIHNRINSRLKNFDSVPEIVSAIQNGIEEFFQQGRIPEIKSFVDQDKIRSSIETSIEQLISTAIDELLLNDEWIASIEQLAQQQMLDRVTKSLNSINLDAEVARQVEKSFSKWHNTLLTDFRTTGIVDRAEEVELDIANQQVNITNSLSTPVAEITDTATVRNLIVTGTINTDNRSWNELAQRASELAIENATDEWRQSLINQVLETAKTTGIDFDTITINGAPLVEDGVLNKSIKHSKLTSVGTLRNLDIENQLHVGDQAFTVKNNRIGINTFAPDMTVTLWDDEVSMRIGKLKKTTGYIGTGSNQDLVLGIDKDPYISLIADKNLVSVNNLRIDRWRIAFESTIPGWSGTRGDVVFNKDPKPDSPFAWQCLGGFKWEAIGR